MPCRRRSDLRDAKSHNPHHRNVLQAALRNVSLRQNHRRREHQGCKFQCHKGTRSEGYIYRIPVWKRAMFDRLDNGCLVRQSRMPDIAFLFCTSYRGKILLQAVNLYFPETTHWCPGTGENNTILMQRMSARASHPTRRYNPLNMSIRRVEKQFLWITHFFNQKATVSPEFLPELVLQMNEDCAT